MVSKIINNICCKIVALFLMSVLLGCNKILDEKPLKSLSVPESIEDLQALLNFRLQMNNQSPELLELITDNYYTTTTFWQAANMDERLNYIWAGNATSASSWNALYQKPIYYSNIVLDQIGKIVINNSDRIQGDYIRGTALFYRAFAFYQLAQLYCKPFSATSNSDLGIVLRLNSNINDKSKRSTVKETYDQIVRDFTEASELLPENVQFPSQPSRAAAYGALARTYLCMGDYNNAKNFADKCLKEVSVILDYNIILDGDAPFGHFNDETIFYNYCEPYSYLLYGSRGKIDSTLYHSYHDNDLRKQLFFKENPDGTYRFKGAYDGDYYSNLIFDGLTTAEMLLIRSECFAREGDKDAALTDLNMLLRKRWKNNGSWNEITAANADDAKSKILDERRKELVYRGLRWTDIRRLNVEGANIALKRIIGGVEYILAPGDPRWVLLIPQDVIIHSGIAQNQR
ncbi:MAG: RagB/SusD family nutrient uptake outer membrane protein [Candidatus Pseudobacter hemicellulosilyticus]|uniref:RagB/SusD family nutrient uptake outer membrane protein n=1 Tax=Candidatus Pseudobacter hemicellulosilyticus TaxID=3121375 RepID=A0AAJ5WY83_9BACT|nr:MAG: RagB/SusD family nutrient uptake outer membrane protein [Pseudobacter sp.]